MITGGNNFIDFLKNKENKVTDVDKQKNTKKKDNFSLNKKRKKKR